SSKPTMSKISPRQKQRTTSVPRSLNRAIGYPKMLATGGSAMRQRRVPSGEASSMAGIDSGQTLFAILFQFFWGNASAPRKTRGFGIRPPDAYNSPAREHERLWSKIQPPESLIQDSPIA
ncbi:hypothetical protein, partial [Blastomonas sp. CCH1-A6]|uniref:hypothetical protein n=1 Tax=Blastomonas sp. CCH1-A6 TaxID=1768762 RepID=UPI001E4CC32B